MDSLKQKIVAFAKQDGVDLIGFAGRDRFADVDPRYNPFSIFPEAKTVILLGKRICRGSLRGVEEGTNFGDYALFGKNWLEDEFLALSAYNLTNFIEEFGWEAAPVFPNPPEIEPAGVSVAPGRPAPNVYPDFDYAAVACGLCSISYNRIAFSKEFGSRQRFHMSATAARPAPMPAPWVPSARPKPRKSPSAARPSLWARWIITSAASARTVPSLTASLPTQDPTGSLPCATVPAWWVWKSALR